MSKNVHLTEEQKKKFINDVKRDYIPMFIVPSVLELFTILFYVFAIFKGLSSVAEAIICCIVVLFITLPFYISPILDVKFMQKSLQINDFSPVIVSKICTRWHNRLPYKEVYYESNGKSYKATVDVDDTIVKGTEIIHIKGLKNHVYSVEFMNNL